MDCFLSSLLNALISLYHYCCHPLFQPESLNYFKCLYLCFQFFLVPPSSFYCGRNINIILLLSCFISWRHKITSYHSLNKIYIGVQEFPAPVLILYIQFLSPLMTKEEIVSYILQFLCNSLFPLCIFPCSYSNPNYFYYYYFFPSYQLFSKIQLNQDCLL